MEAQLFKTSNKQSIKYGCLSASLHLPCGHADKVARHQKPVPRGMPHGTCVCIAQSLQWVSINPKLIFTGDKPSGFYEIQHIVSTWFLYNTLQGTKTVCTTGSGGSSPRAESMKEVCFSIGGLFHIGKRRKRWDSLRKLMLLSLPKQTKAFTLQLCQSSGQRPHPPKQHHQHTKNYHFMSLAGSRLGWPCSVAHLRVHLGGVNINPLPQLPHPRKQG